MFWFSCIFCLIAICQIWIYTYTHYTNEVWDGLEIIYLMSSDDLEYSAQFVWATVFMKLILIFKSFLELVSPWSPFTVIEWERIPWTSCQTCPFLLVRVWSIMKVSKEWQNFRSWVNCLFLYAATVFLTMKLQAKTSVNCSSDQVIDLLVGFLT